MDDWPLLSTIIFLPLLGAVLLTLIRGRENDVALAAKATALWVAVSTFLLTLVLWRAFDIEYEGFQFTESRLWIADSWIADSGIGYRVGVDGVSLFFVVLASFLTVLCILASWRSIAKRVRDYMVAFLVLESLSLGAFLATDTVLFYLFFEGVLLPMFYIIGVWGGERRIYAAFKFFLYTLFGSLLMLLSILSLAWIGGTTSLTELMLTEFSPALQKILWLGFFASFAVKTPMWPFHTWLPDAHVEAPTAGSVMLAGLLLKMGGYGFLRFCLPILPDASQFYAPLVFVLSAVAVVYASLVALVQTDIKKLIAYSSVAHMGFVTAGLFANNTQALSGAVMQMISHGLVSAALFLCVGILYERAKTRDIGAFRAVVQPMPVYARLTMVFTLASIGLPGTSGFIGEILTLLGVFRTSPATAWVLAFGMILSAGYMLHLYRRVFFGASTAKPEALYDLHVRENVILTSLVLPVLWIGLYPMPFLRIITIPLQPIIALTIP